MGVIVTTMARSFCIYPVFALFLAINLEFLSSSATNFVSMAFCFVNGALSY
jgi:hypothetical protein